MIIGSTALKIRFPEARDPKDLDVFSWRTDYGDDVFWDPNLGEYPRASAGEFLCATVDELYTIKKSHAYWELPNGSWGKHMKDLLFLKEKGANSIPELHSLLYKIWEGKHGKKKVNLSYESDQFFKDAVVRKYDHDSIHASVAFGDEPLYLQTLKDGHSVAVDSKKMWSMGFDNLINLFREEIYATALERIIIPSEYTASRGRAYQWALRRTITSLTKGRSAEFIVDNFDIFRTHHIRGVADDYVSRHLDNKSKLILLEA